MHPQRKKKLGLILLVVPRWVGILWAWRLSALQQNINLFYT